jgi:outer membrane protein TolC
MRTFFTILCTTLAPALYAQQNLTLEECLRAGIENNYGVKIARGDAQIAANNVTYAPFLPQVTAGARQNQDRFSERSAYRDSEDVRSDYAANLYNVDVALGWRLFDGMAMFATRETQKELLQQGELNLRRSLEELTVDISSQYYYIVTQQDRLNIARQSFVLSTERRDIARLKHTIGSFSAVEENQALIDFNADSSQLVLQQDIIHNAYVRLFELMNSDLNSPAQIQDTILPDGSLTSEELIQSAMRNNTAIRMSRLGQRLSQLDLKIARSSLYPTLDFNAAYRYNYSSKSDAQPLFTDHHGPNWGFTISMPLFRGMETRRGIRNAGIGVENSRLLYEQTCTSVNSSILQYFNTYRVNFTMIGFEERSATAAFENVTRAVEMFRQGAISGIEFREMQRSYLDAMDRELDAIYNAKISEIGLRYLAGQVL